MKKLKKDEKQEVPEPVRLGFGHRVRNYFFTGLVIAAPIGITLFITWSFIQWVDAWVKPYIPHIYNPDNYLPFSVPGVGLIFSFLIITILGFLTANFVGRNLVTFGEVMVGRMPLVRNLYNALKQIFETALSQKGQTFTKAAVIEYPRRGLWALCFIATRTKGEVAHRLEDHENSDTGHISVFLPTTPNPTSGFLLFVPRDDVIILDMSVEDAAKLVISAGLVTPDFIADHAIEEDEDKAQALTGKGLEKSSKPSGKKQKVDAGE
ncbi:DUF502 domain-containing protein [Cohaesibacter celericrescens]|uniref:DUF502 domain-containing protein n=1 Tax=Cohaesibacter celericrescens TaxID=2067669 RepID=A0A2N5XTH3_9HYPH|nr:DUF502 domain-containing protein [Cohaesibacter celericrescens]PLW77747.1 hypothetical protein C0081_10075 [Cohaesibacter celericrescens]